MKKTRLTCPFCGRMFTSRLLMESHKNTSHLRRSPYPCPTCKTPFTSQDQLQQHVQDQNHFQKDPLFQDEQHLPRFEEMYNETVDIIHDHEDVYGMSTEENFRCMECGRNFPTSGRLLVHLEQHVSSLKSAAKNLRENNLESKKIKCNICPKTFFNERWAKVHKKYHHKGALLSDKAFRCKKCDKLFSTVDACDMHEKLACSKMTISCSKCDQEFKSTVVYAQHLKQHQKDEGDFPCVFCHFRFVTTEEFVSHCVEEHKDKNFLVTCEECGVTHNNIVDAYKHGDTHENWAGKRMKLGIQLSAAKCPPQD